MGGGQSRPGERQSGPYYSKPATLGQIQERYRKREETEPVPRKRVRVEMPDESTATLGQIQEYYKKANANVSVEFGTPPRQGTVARNLPPDRSRIRPLPRPMQDLGPMELPELMLEAPDTGERLQIGDRNVSARTRAHLLGLTEVSCQYIDFAPGMCPGNLDGNGNYNDPITIEPFGPGDRVWRTSEGTCFGPDTGEPYRPFYYRQDGREVDVMIDPLRPYNRLPGDCFERN